MTGQPPGSANIEYAQFPDRLVRGVVPFFAGNHTIRAYPIPSFDLSSV